MAELGDLRSLEQLERSSCWYSIYFPETILVRVQPLISYFSYMHYHIIVLHSYVVLTVFDLLERCVSLVLRLAI